MRLLVFSRCLEQCSLKNASPISNWHFCSEQSCYTKPLSARSVCAVTAAPKSLLREGKHVWPWTSRTFLYPGIRRKLRKQKEAVGCRILHCSFEGFSLLLWRPTKVHHFGKMEMCEEFGSYQASLLGSSYSVTIQTKLGFPKLADGAWACFICEFWTQNHSLWQLQYWLMGDIAPSCLYNSSW